MALPVGWFELIYVAVTRPMSSNSFQDLLTDIGRG
jgi:hypothetical protein